MGFCRRCGDITNSTRCSKCGGTSKDGSTKVLFAGGDGTAEKPGGASDKWGQRYLAKSPTSSSPTSPAPSAASPRPALTRGPSSRPASPTKSLASFVESTTTTAELDGELSSVFGSVLSPRDHWGCVACGKKFAQEEVIYPHPDASKSSSDPTTQEDNLKEAFFCRACFASRFSKGTCKKCRLAVLSDAPFIKHDQNLWHDTCYACSYCPNESGTQIIIDFGGQPSCENCFDEGAYLKRGIPASPHLSQTGFSFDSPAPAAPPARSKWGRPSTSSSSVTAASSGSPWTSSKSSNLTSNQPVRRAAASSTTPESSALPQRPSWRLQQARDSSPMASSFDELGDKMRKAGLKVDRVTASSSMPPPVVKRSAPSASPSWQSTSTPKLYSLSVRDDSPSNVFLNSGGSNRNMTSPPTATPPLRTASATLSPVPPVSAPVPAPVMAINSKRSEDCTICHRPLGTYGSFIQLPAPAHDARKSGNLTTSDTTTVHQACFACGKCRAELGGGKHVQAEGRWWHQECAPPRRRYRSIITSLREQDSAEAEAAQHEISSESADPRLRKPSLSETIVDTGIDLDVDADTCAACDQLLGPAQCVTLPRSGKTFHRACFRCGTCRLQLATVEGGRAFVDVEGVAYHSTCAPRAKITPSSTPTSCTAGPLRSSTSRAPFLPSISTSPAAITASSSLSSRSAGVTSFSSPNPTAQRKLSSSPSSSSSIFATRTRPLPSLGGHPTCAGCALPIFSASSSSSSSFSLLDRRDGLVPGPRGTKFHAKCLKCAVCGKREGLDSESRLAPPPASALGGRDGEGERESAAPGLEMGLLGARLRCEACRKAETRKSYTGNGIGVVPLSSSTNRLGGGAGAVTGFKR